MRPHHIYIFYNSWNDTTCKKTTNNDQITYIDIGKYNRCNTSCIQIYPLDVCVFYVHANNDTPNRPLSSLGATLSFWKKMCVQNSTILKAIGARTLYRQPYLLLNGYDINIDFSKSNNELLKQCTLLQPRATVDQYINTSALVKMLTEMQDLTFTRRIYYQLLSSAMKISRVSLYIFTATLLIAYTLPDYSTIMSFVQFSTRQHFSGSRLDELTKGLILGLVYSYFGQKAYDELRSAISDDPGEQQCRLR